MENRLDHREEKFYSTRGSDILRGKLRKRRRNSSLPTIVSSDSTTSINSELSDSKTFSSCFDEDLKDEADESKLCANGRDSIAFVVDLNVPRRPRGILRRKNSSISLKQLPRSRSGRINKVFGFKENGSSRCDLSPYTKQINEFTIHKASKKIKRCPNPCEKTDRTWEYEEEDEGKLEQNAAEMLSSQFYPKLSEDSPVRSLSSSSSSLNQGCVKKLRNFYEICSRAVDPYWILKHRISVFLPKDQSWYLGLVKDYNPVSKLHYVKYDDRDEEWLDLEGQKFKLLCLPNEFMSRVREKKISFDDCSTSELESEPIISWLTRSTNRLKAVSRDIFKDKSKSLKEKNLPTFLLDDERHESTNEKAADFCKQNDKGNCNDRLERTHFYFRRRPGKKHKNLVNKKKTSDALFDFSYATNFFFLSGFHDKKTDNSSEHSENIWKLISPVVFSSDYYLIQKNFTFSRRCKILPLWPPVLMEIIFLDNIHGLRSFSLDGHLMDAIRVLCVFTRIFHQIIRCDKLTMLKFPSTSVGFKISDPLGKGRPVFFYLYKFWNTDIPWWPRLDHKLNELSVISKDLPLSASTYGNLMNLFSTSGVKSFSQKEEKMEGFAGHSWINESFPISLSFDRMSALLLSLHFECLAKNNTSSKNSEITDPVPSDSLTGNFYDPIFPAGSIDHLRSDGSNEVYEKVISSKSLTPHKKRQHHKRKRPNMEKSFNSTFCKANILIVSGDKGWREQDAHVVLDSDDDKEFQITVNISSVRRYSYKAYQPLQLGTTNRFTHALLWKGGKEWILEFPDRKEWSVFKEIYQECCDLNLKAASVRHIPIPGVSVVDDYYDMACDMLPFFRSSSYFQGVGTELDYALDRSRVVYDLDCEDEEWLSKLRNSYVGISDEMVERAMDRLEKEAFLRHRIEFTEAEIHQLKDEEVPAQFFKLIYEHWLNRRRRKGFPLIRQFQPPLWELYQRQLKEWESSKPTHVNAKPPLFAFCLKPRGLELPKKYEKQRSQKKLSFRSHSLQGKRSRRRHIPYDHWERGHSGERANSVPAGHKKLLMAQQLLSVARLKRERANWLVRRADLAVHRAAAILMTAESMMGVGEEDGSETVSSDLGGAIARGRSGSVYSDDGSSSFVGHGCSSTDEDESFEVDLS